LQKQKRKPNDCKKEMMIEAIALMDEGSNKSSARNANAVTKPMVIKRMSSVAKRIQQHKDGYPSNFHYIDSFEQQAAIMDQTIKKSTKTGTSMWSK
jgi:hypothetical protein